MNENMSRCKPDWQEARQRMTLWWEGGKTDRPPASVTAPAAAPATSDYMNRTPQKYIDPETVFHNLEHMLTHTFWGGEAFPWHYIYFGPMFYVTLFGCEPHFTDNTTWYDPCRDTLDEVSASPFDESNRWWRLIQDITGQSALRSGGRYLINTSSACSYADILAALIGTEKLLIAMAEEPEKVIAARDRLIPTGKTTYEALYRLTREVNGGSIDGMGVWCPGRIRTAQCDLSVMISPGMFEEFVKDDLQSTYDYVDYGIYHLDGEGEIKHLPCLLSMDKIRLIQWVPSAQAGCPGYADPLNWIDLFRRIQEAGKSVLIYCPPERVAPLLDRIDAGRVYLSVHCPDEDTALGVLRDLDRAGRRKGGGL